MVSSRSRGQATTCGQWELKPPGRSSPESALAVSSRRSGVTAEAEVSSLPERKGLENLETAQPETTTGTASSPARQHGRTHQRASERLNLPRPRLDTPGIPA